MDMHFEGEADDFSLAYPYLEIRRRALVTDNDSSWNESLREKKPNLISWSICHSEV